MVKLLRMDASIRGRDSVTRAVADSFESAATEASGATELVRRDLANDPIDARTWALSAATSPLVAGTGQSEDERAAAATAVQIASEFEDADAYLIAAPFYNFGVSQHVKTWADVLLTDSRFGPGAQPPVSGRPAYVVTARGGGYGPGTPMHGWDHGTDWLRRIFGDVLGLDVQLIETELTLAPVTPGMEDLRDLAANNLANAHETAREHGRNLAERLRVAA